MRIGVFSPLNPLKSGISDFTEEVVLKLKDYVEIDLFVDDYKPSNNEIIKKFNIYNISDIDDEGIRNRYDHLIYHIGNHYMHHEKIMEYSLKYPGIIEIHDFALHNLLAAITIARNDIEKYIEVMKLCHGTKGENVARNFLDGKTAAPWETRPLEFPVNKHIVDNAKAIIVHSDYAKQMLKGMGVNKPIKKIYLHTNEINENYIDYERKCKEKLKLSQDTVVLGSFGFATTAKRINEILEALALLKKKIRNFKYYIVGEVQNVNLRDRLEKLDLVENVHSTGFVELDEFVTYMGACDICFNLRFPTQGESSASLHRILGMGKIVFVTRIGTFQEYSDDIVVKIEVGKNEINEIYNNLLLILKDKNKLAEKREKAFRYAQENCRLETNCKKYSDFFGELIYNKKTEEDYLDTIVDKLFELNLLDDSYTKHFATKINLI